MVRVASTNVKTSVNSLVNTATNLAAQNSQRIQIPSVTTAASKVTVQLALSNQPGLGGNAPASLVATGAPVSNKGSQKQRASVVSFIVDWWANNVSSFSPVSSAIAIITALYLFGRFLTRLIRAIVRTGRDPLDRKLQGFTLIKAGVRPRFQRQELAPNFYTGKATQPFECVRCGLDAKRYSANGEPLDTMCLGMINTAIQEKKRFIHLPIWAARNEGKTTFLSRLALSAAESDRYRVLWAHDMNPSVVSIKRLIQENRSRLRRIIAPRKAQKPLMIFVDDLLSNSKTHPERDSEWQDEYLRFISEVELLNVILISSWLRPLDTQRYGTSTLEPVHLVLTEKDRAALLAKLAIEVRPLADNQAKLLSKAHTQYGTQLFAFYCEYYEHLAKVMGENQPTDFIGVYERGYDSLGPEQKKLIQLVAACQVLHLLLPKIVWDANTAHDEIFSKMPSLRLEAEEPGVQAAGYHMGGPFLAYWLLITKCRMSHEQVQGLYGELFDGLLKLPQITDVELAALRETLDRLLWGGFDPLGYGVGKQRSMAVALFNTYRAPLIIRVKTANLNEVCRWSITITALGGADLALELLSSAFARDGASSAAQEKNAALNRAFHMAASQLKNQGPPYKRAALHLFEQFEKISKPDALLMLMQGMMSEELGDYQAANKAFISAVAASNDANPFTSAMCLQRYGIFLARFPAYSESIEKTEGLFGKANLILANIGLLNTGIYDAWALWRIAQRDYIAADALYSESERWHRNRKRIHPQTWVSYANFLHKHTADLKDVTAGEILEHAELLCKEVLSEHKVNVRSIRPACIILGRLIGLAGSKGHHPAYSFQGAPRPNLAEAVATLDKAFESPEPARNDDLQKTWQDVKVHCLLKDIYLGHYHETNEPELLDKARFHFERSVAGIPRPGLDTLEQRKYAVTACCGYGWFLCRKGEWVEGERNFQKACEITASISDVEFRVQTHQFYARFLSELTLHSIAFKDEVRARTAFEKYEAHCTEILNLFAGLHTRRATVSAVQVRKRMIWAYCNYAQFIWQQTLAIKEVQRCYQCALSLCEKISDVTIRNSTSFAYAHTLHTALLQACRGTDGAAIRPLFSAYIEQMAIILGRSPGDSHAARELGLTWTIVPGTQRAMYANDIVTVLWNCWQSAPGNVYAVKGLLSWLRASTDFDVRVACENFARTNPRAAESLRVAERVLSAPRVSDMRTNNRST